MNRFLAALLLISLTQLSQAQTELEGMSLRGLAVYEQLRTDYYIAGLYLPSPAITPDDAFFMPGPKRMDIRVVAESWSKRRFVQQWNQLILINNNADTQKAQSDNIIAFASLLKDDLRAGDHITIDMIPDQGTVVKLNGTTLQRTNDPDFFNLLLSCWIGARPPSSMFKQDILQLPAGDRGASLMTSFDIIAPSQSRIAETQSWAGSSAAAKPSKPAETAAAPSQKPAPTDEAAEQAAEKERREAEAEKARLAKIEQDRLRKEAIAKALAAAEARAKAAARSKELINEYSSTMVRASYQYVRYPKRALKLNQEGTVLLEVIIDRKGELISSKVIQSSGYSALDDAAISAVEKTAPFPAIPEGILGNQIEFTLPFTFQISS